MLVRPATSQDVGVITRLYNELGVATTASYDLEPVSVQNRQVWLDDHLAHGWPVLVADDAEHIVGFAAYGSFRPKAGYRFTVENSIYVAADHQGVGTGRALMARLIEIARDNGMHAMVAVVDAAATGSISFHRALGFVTAGTLPQVGRKFDRWLDVTFLVLPLDDGTPDHGFGIGVEEARRSTLYSTPREPAVLATQLADLERSRDEAGFLREDSRQSRPRPAVRSRSHPGVSVDLPRRRHQRSPCGQVPAHRPDDRGHRLCQWLRSGDTQRGRLRRPGRSGRRHRVVEPDRIPQGRRAGALSHVTW